MAANRVFIAGVTPKNFALDAARKAANPGYKANRLNGWQLSAMLRLSEIKKLAALRLAASAPIGAESSWIECIANALKVRHGTINMEMIAAEAASLRLGALNDGVVADAVEHFAKEAWGRYKLYSPRLAGNKLQLTAVERERAGITRITAIDETPRERRRRQDKARKADKRAAEAALAAPKVTKKRMAESLGISRPTLDAWIEKGIVDPETGELR